MPENAVLLWHVVAFFVNFYQLLIISDLSTTTWGCDLRSLWHTNDQPLRTLNLKYGINRIADYNIQHINCLIYNLRLKIFNQIEKVIC